MKKKHGWILQADNGKFADDTGGDTCDIAEARVFDTREQARIVDDFMVKLDTDVVRKVKLNKKGRAIKIIPGR